MDYSKFPHHRGTPSSTGERQARHLDTLGTPSLHRLNPDGSVSRKVNGRLYVDPAPSGVTDPAWDYLVWPTSTAHPAGVKTKDGVEVPPVASMALTGGGKGLKRKEHSKLEAGPHDWISKDAKRSLSYDHGRGFRYRLDGVLLDTGSAMETNALFVKGRKIKTVLPVSGAAIFTAKNNDGATVTKAVYSSTEQGSKALHLRVSSLRADENGDPVEEALASWLVPEGFGDRVISQPVFFSGDGAKFVTVVSTRSLDQLSVGAPHYALRGSLSLNSSGEVEVDMVESALELAPGHADSTVTRSVYEPNQPGASDGPFTSFVGNNALVVVDTTTTVDDPFFGPYTSFYEFRQLGAHDTALDTRRVELVGLDMAADGTELLIERVVDYVRVVNYSQSLSIVETLLKTKIAGTNPGEISERNDVSRAYREDRVSSTRTTETVSFTVNREPFASVVTSDISTGGTATTANDYSYSFTPGDPPAYFPLVKTYTPEYAESLVRSISVRGIDGRTRAIALVIGERPVVYAGVRPLKVILRAHCAGHEFAKTVFDGRANTVPSWLGVNVSLYRPFASRRPGEFVICFSPDDSAHAQPKPFGPLGFFGCLEPQGAVDREPLFALRRKDKVIGPSPNKFSLDTEPGFRLDPVHIL